MSWYIHASGKPIALVDELARQFGNVKCSEPEETIKNNAFALISTALSKFPASAAVRVTAQGSQTTIGDDGKQTMGAGEAINSLEIKIEPLWRFVE